MAYHDDAPPFMTPPPEAGRFQGNKEMFSDPEKRMSGNLPDQPAGLSVDATGESSDTPWKNLSSGR